MLPSNNLFERRSIVNEIEIALGNCNSIKYAAYRTAAKLRIIQKAMLMNKVPLKVISNVFERHQLYQTENMVQLDTREMESILLDIYFTVHRESDDIIDINHISQLMIAFLLNVFDVKGKNVIQVLSFKISLTLLCQAKPREKYHYLFDQLADHNKCLSRKKLQVLLIKLTALTEYISEGLSFGSELITGTVESCFNFNIGTLGISEDNFISWLMEDPQMLVWLSTFYRLQISESVVHNVKCAICKIYPISGLRYKCLRCLSFDMCQTCFFNGKSSKNHKLYHPVQEYCCPMTSQQLAKAFLITLRNRLYKKNLKPQYLPALRVDSSEIESLGLSTMFLNEMDVSSRTGISDSRISIHRFPVRELQSIIFHLERESNKLIPQIDDLCNRMGNASVDNCHTQLILCLKMHRDEVESQVHRLKLLKNLLMSSRKLNGRTLVASTPVERISNKTPKIAVNELLENLSPIESQTCGARKDEMSDRKLMWDNYDLVNYGFDESWKEMKRVSSSEKEVVEKSPEPKESLSWHSINESNGSNESEICLSTWLGGKTFLGLDSGSRGAFTWLQEDVFEDKSDQERIAEENEETLQELQLDLRKISEKLEELSKSNFKGNNEDGGNASHIEKVDIHRVEEVDSLLVNLIKGIGKFIEV